MIDERELKKILSNITLPPGWRLNVQPVTTPLSHGWNVQILFKATDNNLTPDDEDMAYFQRNLARALDSPVKEQHCRKWYVSQHSTVSEVVRTVYKAGVAAWEHEFDETFRYKGVAIYNPHVNVEHLAEELDQDNYMRHVSLDVRPEPK